MSSDIRLRDLIEMTRDVVEAVTGGLATLALAVERGMERVALSLDSISGFGDEDDGDDTDAK